MQPHLRIHVLFVGEKEHDVKRAIFGIQMLRADKVYVVTKSDMDAYADLFESTKEEIREIGIEVQEAKVAYYDVLEVMKLCAKLIKEENEKGNEVFFNLSSGGKLLSAAITLSCSIFNADLYYVKEDYPEKTISTEEPIIKFPKYHINKPGKDLIQFMYELVASHNNQYDRSFTKKECLKICKEKNIGEFNVRAKDKPRKGDNSSGDYNKMRLRFLDKLVDLQYIMIENKTRGRITITDAGMFSLNLFTTFYGLQGK
jgi:hypothetical protein